MSIALPEGVSWSKIYWVRGQTPRGSSYASRVKDPPCSGWQHAFIMHGEKRSIIFCPFTYMGFQVNNKAGEISQSIDMSHTFAEAGERLMKLMADNWKVNQAFGFNKDYDTATVLLRKFKQPIPDQILKGGEEDNKKRGGKPAAETLLKLVKPATKRGKFLSFFMKANGERSVRECMAEFEITRSNALSYLHLIHKDHGIGYALVGDNAVLEFPPGVSDPFNEPGDLEDF